MQSGDPASRSMFLMRRGRSMPSKIPCSLLFPLDILAWTRFILRRIVPKRWRFMSDRSSLLPALTLRQVQYFVALAHARSFTQAAQSLSLTQPALTAAIRQIEFLLGGPLFARSAHRLTLTAAGVDRLPRTAALAALHAYRPAEYRAYRRCSRRGSGYRYRRA